MEEHKPAIEQIKETLLWDVRLQEQIRGQFKKILNRLTFIYILVGIVLIMGVTRNMYILSQPTPPSELMKELQKNIIEQIRIIRTQDSLLYIQTPGLNK